VKNSFIKACFIVLVVISFCPFVSAQDLQKDNNLDYRNVSVSISLKEIFNDLKTPLENPDEILKSIKSAIEEKYKIKINKNARFDIGACIQDVLMSYEHIAKLSLGCAISEFDIEFNSKTARAYNFAQKTDRIYESPSLKAVIKYDCDASVTVFTCKGHQY
jgi:hypothetical protein